MIGPFAWLCGLWWVALGPPGEQAAHAEPATASPDAPAAEAPPEADAPSGEAEAKAESDGSVDPAPARATVTLRPVDAATVRVVAVHRIARKDGVLGIGFAHGSAVVVDPAGWAITAAHVIDEGVALVVLLPGRDEALPAIEVERIADRDLALIRFAGGAPTALEVRQGRDIALGQRVHASGYPLDPRERWPAAAVGQIGRPLNDGRLQLSISLNPGNSGGPVVDDEGALVGVVSQGADPRKGAQGFAIIQPVDPLVPALRAAIEAGGEGPAPVDVSGDVLVEQIGVRTPPPLAERVERLRAVRGLPEATPAALLALEGEAVQRLLLAEGGDEAAADAVVIGASTGVWLKRAGLSPTPAASPRAAEASPEASAPSPASDSGGFSAGGYFHGGLTTVFDDHPRNEDGSLSALGVLFGFGVRAGAGRGLLRPMAVVGIESDLGLWRSDLRATGLLVAGARLATGRFGGGFIFEAAYTPGYMLAESRVTSTWIGYRLAVGARQRGLEYIVSWSELGRQADSTLRTMSITLGAGF